MYPKVIGWDYPCNTLKAHISQFPEIVTVISKAKRSLSVKVSSPHNTNPYDGQKKTKCGCLRLLHEKFSGYLPGYSWKLIIIDVEKTPDVDAFLTETALFTASTASVATFVANAAGSLTKGGLATWHGLPKWLSCPYWAKHGAVAIGSAGAIYWPIRSQLPTNMEPNKHQSATADPGLVTAH
jgi:hypothetical protein